MKNVHDTTKKLNVFFGTMNQNHQLQCNANSGMDLARTFLTLTALRDGLKTLWRPGAFWIAKDRVGHALMKRLLMLSV